MLSLPPAPLGRQSGGNREASLRVLGRAARVVAQHDARLAEGELEATASQRIHIHSGATATCPNAQQHQAEPPTCEEANRMCGGDSEVNTEGLLGGWRVHDHTRGRFCDGRPGGLTVPKGGP